MRVRPLRNCSVAAEVPSALPRDRSVVVVGVLALRDSASALSCGRSRDARKYRPSAAGPINVVPVSAPVAAASGGS